jgi:hypothetical protein
MQRAESKPAPGQVLVDLGHTEGQDHGFSAR